MVTTDQLYLDQQSIIFMAAQSLYYVINVFFNHGVVLNLVYELTSLGPGTKSLDLGLEPEASTP